MTIKEIRTALDAYNARLTAWQEQEPPQLTAEQWDDAWNYISVHDEVPPEYADRIGKNTVTVHSDIVNGKHTYIPEGKDKSAYYDIVHEQWNAQFAEIRKMIPQIPYSELPDSLKRTVRERFTADTLASFLRTIYELPDGTTPGYDSLIAGIPEKDMQKLFVRIRNTAVYTIMTQELEPQLFGNAACDAFEQVIDEYRTTDPAAARTGARKNTVARAEKAGNIVSVGFYQRHISDKDYMHALTAERNKTAYIAVVQPGAFDKLQIDENGIVTYDKQFAGVLKKNVKGKYTDIADIDFPLLVQFYTAAFNAAQTQDAKTVTVYMPSFFREMGIETASGNASDIMKKIQSFHDLWGIMEKEGIAAKVFSLIEIDAKKQTLTFAVPYIMHLFESLGLKNKVERTTKAGELLSYDKPFHNMLIHSAIVSERNKPAIEIVTVLTARMLQRGFVPDVKAWNKKNIQNVKRDEVTYHDRFRNILNDCPLLRGRVQSYASDSDKNKALRRAFEKAYKLIHTRTDAEKYFCGLKFDTVIPTMNTLDMDWTFSHTGRNGQYKPQK